jgi:putative peptidoglycan lipid II flippase
MAVTDDRDHHTFFRGAAIIAALTVLSRVFGLVRDSAISAMGATHTMGAFRVAFSIPNLFRRLFGEGAVSAAFVPVFTEVAETKGWERARLVLAGASGLLAAILAGLLLVGELVLLAWLGVSGGDADHRLLLQLTMIVLPFMVTVCLLALGSAALNCRKHFAYPAFAPVLLNLFMISGAFVAHRFFAGATPGGLRLLAGSVTVAGLVQLGAVIWMLRRMRLLAFPRLRPILPEVRRIAQLTLPMIVPLGVLQFSAFFDRAYAHVLAIRPGDEELTVFGWVIARPLGEGVVTWFDNANRLYQFPMAILGISLATAVFPLFSRYAAAGDVPGLQRAANRALRLCLFLGIPAGVALAILAEPVMSAIFRHGLFTASDAAESAFMLRLYCAGMWAYFCNHILLRAFFAQQDTRTPLRVSCALVVVNMAMVVTLVFTPLKSGAIPLATATTATLNTLILVTILRNRWGRLGLRSVAASTARIAIATGAMATALWWTMDRLLPEGCQLASFRQIVSALALCVPVGAGIYAALTRALGSPELGELWSSIRRKSA